AQSATEGQTVRLPPVLMQPIAADDVAAVMADVALAEPLNGTFDLAGPEPIRQDDLVRQFLNATGDARTVITDPKALYYGIPVNEPSPTPAPPPAPGPHTFGARAPPQGQPGRCSGRRGVIVFGPIHSPRPPPLRAGSFGRGRDGAGKTRRMESWLTCRNLSLN